MFGEEEWEKGRGQEERGGRLGKVIGPRDTTNSSYSYGSLRYSVLFCICMYMYMYVPHLSEILILASRSR